MRAFSGPRVHTVRGQVYQMAGKVVHHAGAVLLKVAEDVLDPFRTLRERCCRLWCREGSP